jgi:lysophospholipase L1-like esterase
MLTFATRMRLGRMLTVAALTFACGRSPSGPDGPPVAPTPTAPVPVHPIGGVVFYDEDGNGRLDPGEDARIPGVVVGIGGPPATSATEGRFTVTAPEGTRTPEVQSASLPPFFAAPVLTALAVPPPAPFELAVPLRLPIGNNRAHAYMAFGDSITQGDGSRRREGYRHRLETLLTNHWGPRARVIDEGVSATRSDDGAARIDAALRGARPAYTLVLYGTNDWNTFACRRVDSCFTLNSVRSMIRSIRAAGSLPVIGTLPPVNPSFTDRLAEDRNGWITATNLELRPLIRAEGGVVADVHAAMLRVGGSRLDELFSDHVHPNDDGYAVIADEFFRAIVSPARP